jgi:hypothetical protein
MVSRREREQRELWKAKRDEYRAPWTQHGISTRVAGILMNDGITEFSDIAKFRKRQLLAIPLLGEGAWSEIETMMLNNGYVLDRDTRWRCVAEKVAPIADPSADLVARIRRFYSENVGKDMSEAMEGFTALLAEALEFVAERIDTSPRDPDRVE